MSFNSDDGGDSFYGRLDEDEEALSQLAPVAGAMGEGYSDYRNMYDLFQRAIQPAITLQDSAAFVNAKGGWNPEVMNVYVRLISTAIKAMSELNRMRNADRMTAALLEEQTKAVAQSAARRISVELRGVQTLLEEGSIEAAQKSLQHFLSRGLPDLLLDSSVTSLREIREEYGLH